VERGVRGGFSESAIGEARVFSDQCRGIQRSKRSSSIDELDDHVTVAWLRVTPASEDMRAESWQTLSLRVAMPKNRCRRKLACDVALAISDWLRISFMVWLSSESRMLMGFEDVGSFKAHAMETFKSILHMTVKSSLKTQSPIPDWAASKIKESWNVQ
jgi:hypothetical protein